MEIASSWKLHPEKQSKFNELSSNLCLFSPDCKTFCKCRANSIDFITSEGQKSKNFRVDVPEEITCISTVLSSPWILSFGTSKGRVFFYNYSTDKHISISPDEQPVKFLKMCSFTESYFTKPYPVLYIQYPGGICVTIEQENILKNVLNNTPNNVSFTKLQISNTKNILDSVVVNSSIPFPVFSDLHRFPAIYSVGKPFISVSSIPQEQTMSVADNVVQKAKQFFKWLVVSPDPDEDDKEEIPILNANPEWGLNEDKRAGTSISADPTGRWLAICDNMFRVVIVDSVFGHITKVLKGYRDAQVAWFCPTKESFKNPFLIIYVPTREIIVACTIPNGSIVAAVKVVRDGKLFQTIDEKSGRGVVFLYPTGDVAILNVTATVKNDSDNDTSEKSDNDNDNKSGSFEDSHFTFPSVITVEKKPPIVELQKLLLQKKFDREEAKKLTSDITDKATGGYFIKTLVNSASSRSAQNNGQTDDDFLLDIINILSKKLNVTNFEGSSREFFDSTYSSVTGDSENDLTVYKILSDKWLEYSKFEKITVSDDQYPQTDLTDNFKGQISNVIDQVYSSNDKGEVAAPADAVKKPFLRAFLTNPLKFPMFFFSFLRSADVKADAIFDSFRFSRENRDEFVMQLLVWIVKCQPAQVLVSQEAIAGFLKVKEIKNTALKVYKKLDVGSDSFGASAISDFLS